jgi:hypothetical protein
MACTLLPNLYQVKIGTISLDGDWLFFCTKQGQIHVFLKGRMFYAIKFFFQRGRVHYWLSEGGSTIGFQKGSPISKCVYLYVAPSLSLKKRVPIFCITLYFFKECLENHEYRVDHNPCSRFNLCKSHNICIRSGFTVLHCLIFNIQTEVLSLTVFPMCHSNVYL